MNQKLIDKLQKIMALTTSPIEGEAQAATAKLQQMLAQHNLDIADLEQKGAKAPEIKESGHDLGKAAFKWKLDLAEAVASHFFCFALVDRRTKTVKFIGRPDNVDSMKMLYNWLIEQIKQVSSAKRKEFLADNPTEHVDPLRWQVQFGVGVVSRMGERLNELKAKQQEEAGTALVIHHETEISDYMENIYGYRPDGKQTKWAKERAERWAKEQAEKEALKESDIEAFYAKYPWERPLTEKELAAKAKQEARDSKKWNDQWERRMERERIKEANKSPEQMERERQEWIAKSSGQRSAKEINLEPFLGTSSAPSDAKKI